MGASLRRLATRVCQDTKLSRIVRHTPRAFGFKSKADVGAKSGPLDALEDFLGDGGGPGRHFRVERKWEYLLYTQHAKGFLRKVGPHDVVGLPTAREEELA